MRNRDRQTESPGSGTARIYVQDSIAHAARRFVRMTAYHDMKLGGFRVQVEGLNIVQYVNVDACRFGYGCFRERFRPVGGIDVAANGYHWSNVRKGFQYAWVAHVTGMNDQVRAAHGLQGFRAQQAVGVGD